MKEYLSDDARNLQIFNDTYKLAHEQILNGTATSQVMCFFLKYGAEYEKNKLELEKLRAETALAESKIKLMEESRNSAAMFSRVMKALSTYRGLEAPSDSDIEAIIDGTYQNVY